MARTSSWGGPRPDDSEKDESMDEEANNVKLDEEEQVENVGELGNVGKKIESLRGGLRRRW